MKEIQYESLEFQHNTFPRQTKMNSMYRTGESYASVLKRAAKKNITQGNQEKQSKDQQPTKYSEELKNKRAKKAKKSKENKRPKKAKETTGSKQYNNAKASNENKTKKKKKKALKATGSKWLTVQQKKEKLPSEKRRRPRRSRIKYVGFKPIIGGALSYMFWQKKDIAERRLLKRKMDKRKQSNRNSIFKTNNWPERKLKSKVDMEDFSVVVKTKSPYALNSTTFPWKSFRICNLRDKKSSTRYEYCKVEPINRQKRRKRKKIRRKKKIIFLNRRSKLIAMARNSNLRNQFLKNTSFGTRQYLSWRNQNVKAKGYDKENNEPSTSRTNLPKSKINVNDARKWGPSAKAIDQCIIEDLFGEKIVLQKIKKVKNSKKYVKDKNEDMIDAEIKMSFQKDSQETFDLRPYFLKKKPFMPRNGTTSTKFTDRKSQKAITKTASKQKFELNQLPNCENNLKSNITEKRVDKKTDAGTASVNGATRFKKPSKSRVVEQRTTEESKSLDIPKYPKVCTSLKFNVQKLGGYSCQNVKEPRKKTLTTNVADPANGSTSTMFTDQKSQKAISKVAFKQLPNSENSLESKITENRVDKKTHAGTTSVNGATKSKTMFKKSSKSRLVEQRTTEKSKSLDIVECPKVCTSLKFNTQKFGGYYCQNVEDTQKKTKLNHLMSKHPTSRL